MTPKPMMLFIKSIKPPEETPEAAAVAPLIDKMAGLLETLKQATGDGDEGSGEGSGDGTPAADGDDDGPLADEGATDDTDNGGDADDMNQGGNGDGAGDDPDAPAGNAAPGADGQQAAADAGDDGGDATDPSMVANGGGDGGAKFGQHNVEAGHHVAFQAGEFKGAGKVSATGADGCTVSDGTGREHRIGWHEVTGHHDAAAAAGADKKPMPPKK